MGPAFDVLVCHMCERLFNGTKYGTNRSVCNAVRERGRQDCDGLHNGDFNDDRIGPLYCVHRRYAKLHELDVHSDDGPVNYGVFRYDWSMRECWRRKLHGVELGYGRLSASCVHRVWRNVQGLYVDIDVH